MIGDLVLYVAALMIVAGGIFGLLAGIGVLRLPDLYTRMHAASKAGLFGSGLTLVGIAMVTGEGAIILRAVLGILFLALTTPVSAHLLARVALKTGHTPLDAENTTKSPN